MKRKYPTIPKSRPAFSGCFRCDGSEKGGDASVFTGEFCYFAFNFINFAVPLYAGRTAAAILGLCSCAGRSPPRPLSQFLKIVSIKTVYLRYAACGCCLYDKNANCYNFYFTNAARTVTITIKAAPKGSSFSSTVRNRSDSAGAAQNFLVRRFFA